jgi:hypothetical protein
MTMGHSGWWEGHGSLEDTSGWPNEAPGAGEPGAFQGEEGRKANGQRCVLAGKMVRKGCRMIGCENSP